MNHTATRSSFFAHFVSKIEHLAPAWFVLVMGWCGLAQTWMHAQNIFGDTAIGLSLVAGAVAILLFGLLCLSCVIRLQVHPVAVQEDMRHPVRHAFMATFPVSMMLLATWGAGLFWNTSSMANTLLRTLWITGSLLELACTVWVLSRWLRSPEEGGLQWKTFSPVLFIPVVGNVLAPLGGVPMGMTDWASAQFGIGVLLWPVLQTLLMVRLVQAGPLPAPMSPTLFISVVPPSVIGLGMMQFQAPDSVIWALWGIAFFFMLWSLTQLRTMLAQPFGLPLWGVSFPLAAFTILTIDVMHATSSAWLRLPATLLTAITSFVIVGLTINTWHALRRGGLLVPDA
jgi:tellurite resistance protein